MLVIVVVVVVVTVIAVVDDIVGYWVSTVKALFLVCCLLVDFTCFYRLLWL